MSVGVAVVDAWALLAFLRGEGQAARSMRRYLRRARTGNLRLLLNLINLGAIVLAIIGIVNVIQRKETELPLVGSLAQKFSI